MGHSTCAPAPTYTATARTVIREGGGAGRSGLSFLAWEDDDLALGICKIPAAAGRRRRRT